MQLCHEIVFPFFLIYDTVNTEIYTRSLHESLPFCNH